MSKAQKGADRGARDRSRVHVLVPLTEPERIAIKHRALDQRCSVGAIVRAALGLEGEGPPREKRAM